MSTDGMMDVEVPTHGTVVVDSGEVQEVNSEKTSFPSCWCKDGKHGPYFRSHKTHNGPPHIVGETTYTVVWTPR